MLNVGYVKYKVRDFIFIYLTRIISIAFLTASKIFSFLGFEKKAVKLLLASIRYSYLPAAEYILYKKYLDFDYSNILSKPTTAKDAESRAIILSPPSLGRSGNLKKGVILITFSHTFSYFLNHTQWDSLNKYFAFVLEPSWAGYADPDILAFAQRSEHCLIQASEIRDRSFMNLMFPSTPCIDTGASNWIDDEFFCGNYSDDSIEKEFDVIYVANLNPIKRVFRAIELAEESKKLNKDFRIAIVCARWGSGSFENLRSFIESKNLRENVILFEGLPQHDLIKLVLRSKCSILLSFKEGSNRVLFESMFLNVPVICLQENIGVNKSYINSQTGLIVPDKTLARAVRFMADNYFKYSPRDWALENISPEITTRKLSNVLKSFYGESVNSILAIKVNSPEVRYRHRDLGEKAPFKSLMATYDEIQFETECKEMSKFFDE